MPKRTNISASHAYLERVTVPFVLPTGIYGAMPVIWHLRQDLQHRFPLHKGRVRDYVRFLAWCATVGRKEYRILRSIPEWNAELSLPIVLPVLVRDGWKDGFSVAMFLYGVAHCHYTFRAILGEVEVRHMVATAFWRGERYARNAPLATAWQREFLRRKFGTMDGFISAIRMVKHDAGKTDAQLREKFHLTDLSLEPSGNHVSHPEMASVSGDLSSETAPLPRGLKRSLVRVPLGLLRAASVVEWFNSKPSEFQLSTVTRLVPVAPKRPPVVKYPFGVNLFGYARGELGIGEDVREVASALQTQRIPFCIVNVEPGKEISQEDHSVEHWVVDQPRYGINLLCITGVEQARFACEKGIEMFSGRYNIGLSPWELPQWPSSCQYAYGMVDEIWGISSHTTRAYRNAPHPVHAMSLPVTVVPIADQGRAEFGLPDKPYLFVFAFDIHSSLSRKNPEGVIRAFQKAFHRESADEVGLVIKVNTLDEGLDRLTVLERLAIHAPRYRAWRAVRRHADQDPRINFIEGAMRRPQVMALYRACDCFVSLHRAEGFGRCMAEALLLNLQVIATGYSGNMDYCAEPRVGLVRYHLRPLLPDEYAWSHGQMWAEPDIDHAAELMRDIRKNPRDTRSAPFDFSPAAIGRRYARRLREIQSEFHLREEDILDENMPAISLP
jgi:hypothetical protein